MTTEGFWLGGVGSWSRFCLFNIPRRITIPMDEFLPSFTSGLTSPFYLYMMAFLRVFMVVLDGPVLLRYKERAALIGGIISVLIS
jgi:hypothetical protein